MAACCLENAWHIYCNCKYCSTFEIQCDFFGIPFNWWTKKRWDVEFESAEKYTRQLLNTCSFPFDNSTRQLQVNSGTFHSVGSNVLSVHKILQVLCLNWIVNIDCTNYIVHRERDLKNRTAHFLWKSSAFI